MMIFITQLTLPFIFVYLLSLPAPLFTQTKAKDSIAEANQLTEDHSHCIDQWLVKRPDLANRFEHRQIAWLCSNTKDWVEKALRPQEVSNDDILTPKQLDWVRGLRTCESLHCLRDLQCKGGGKCKARKSSTDIEAIGFQGRSSKDDDVLGKRRPSVVFMDVTNAEVNNAFTADEIDQVGSNFLAQNDPRSTDAARGRHNAQRRATIAAVCIRVLRSGATAEDSFPSSNLRPKQLSAKFDNWLRKCQLIKREVDAAGKQMDDFLDPTPDLDYFDMNQFNADLSTLSDKDRRELRQVAHRCIAILAARNAETAFTSWSESTVNIQSADELAKLYSRWHQKCNHVKERMTRTRQSLEQFSRISRVKRSLNLDEDTSVNSNNGGETLNRRKRQVEDEDFRGIRKEYRMLSDEERDRFHKAMQQLKTDKIEGRSKYDLLVIYHTPQESPGAHWGPAFLPFHRELLKQLELALRSVDPLVSMPYWDSTLDGSLPDAAESVLWTKEFLGTSQGPVIEGFAANWEATHELGFVPGMRTLFRDVGESPFGGFFQESDLEYVYSRTQYEDLTACVDPTFELVHGVIHMFVGGYMADIGISPNDPAFYMHHCFIDYIWEEFRQTVQNREQRETEYPTDDRACNNFHFGSSQLKPFPVTAMEGLSNNYTDNFYYYEPRPSCSEVVPDCATDYLFCDIANYRCISKVRSGGNCTGFEGTNICVTGSCVGGVCGNLVVTVGPETTTTTTRAPPITTTPTTPTTTTPTTSPTTTTTTTTTTPATTTTPTIPTTTTQRATPPSPPTPPRPTTGAPPSPPGPVVTPVRPEPTHVISHPPLTTTGPGDEPMQTCWFAISVVRGTSIYKQPAIGATVKSCGNNNPRGYDQVLEGKLGMGYSYPYWTGSALVQARHPASAGRWPLVEFTVDVTDRQGRPCAANCYQASTSTYAACTGRVRLSTDPAQSDPIIFKDTEQEALEAMWRMDGRYRRQIPAYLQFVCS